MRTADMLELLKRWRTDGWLRALDLALVRLLLQLDAATPASLLLATALLAHLESRGHSCLPLDRMAQEGLALLGWPTDAAAALSAALPLLPTDKAPSAWHDSAVLQVDPVDAHGATPLVLAGGRLYLRRYWRHETQIAQQVLQRAAHMQTTLSAADRDRARALFGLLFAAQSPSQLQPHAHLQPQLQPDWQQVACALALRGRLTLITGGPGTGKTYTAARLLVLLQALHGGAQPLRVALAAPTGKAAARLRQSIVGALQGLGVALAAAGLPAWDAANAPASTTLHALLRTRPGTRRFVHDAANPLDVDLLFVDEASMVHLEMMDALLAALPPGARLVLLGDKDQLASVEAGAVLGDLCRPPAGYRADTAAFIQQVSGQQVPVRVPEQAPVQTPVQSTVDAGTDLAQQTVLLQHSHRFSGPIGQLALAVNRGDGAAALALLRSSTSGVAALAQARDADAVALLALQGRALDDGGRAAGFRPFLELLQQGLATADAAGFDGWARQVLQQFDRCRVLCALRDGPAGVAGINIAIERLLSERRLLQRRGEWYVGRPVMVTRNDAALGVFNGDIGLVLQPPHAAADAPLRAYFADGDTLRSVSVNRLTDVETAFAMTVHKSQGSEFEHVLLVLPDQDSQVLTRELVYTGITRARLALTVLAGDGRQLAAASQRLTRRVSGLRALLNGDADDASDVSSAGEPLVGGVTAATPGAPIAPDPAATPIQPDLFA